MFVDLFIFYINHLGTPTGIYPENFVKMPLDLAEIFRIRKIDRKMFICLFVCLYVYIFVCFLFNHHRIPTGSFPQNFVKNGLDLAEILRISKLDWHDGGGMEGRREEGKESYFVMV